MSQSNTQPAAGISREDATVLHDASAPAPSQSEPLVAPPPDRYKVEGAFAHGGMGAVLRARELNIGRTVAMKVILKDKQASPEHLQRFLQEARLTGRLEHPNIVPVHELGHDEQGKPYYTMKFVQGKTLHEILGRIKGGDVDTLAHYSLGQLLTIFQKVCDAVAFAHSRGVIHRDLKPENIMVGDYGEVLVMDWGLATMVHNQQPVTSDTPTDLDLNADVDVVHTMDGSVMGTPQFMSPEQADGKVGEMDGRTDIFLLGGILYNILTLRPPVSGRSVTEFLQKIRSGDIPAPTSFNPRESKLRARTQSGATQQSTPPVSLRHCPGNKVPESLSAVAMKALAQKKADRYQTVIELQKDVEAYQGGFATTAEHASVPKLVLLMVRRNRKACLAAGTLTLLFAIGFSIFVRVQQRAKKARYDDLIRSAHVNHDRQNWQATIEALTKAAVILEQPADRRWLVDCLVASAREQIKGQHWGMAAIQLQKALTLDPHNREVSALMPLALGEGFLTITAGFAGEWVEFAVDDTEPTSQPRSRAPLPVQNLKFSAGMHHFEIWTNGQRFISLPTEIVRGQSTTIAIPVTQIPAGYEYIHEGEFISGDDGTEQRDGRVGPQRKKLGSYFMKRSPVSVTEYARFWQSPAYEAILGRILKTYNVSLGVLTDGATTLRDIKPYEFKEGGPFPENLAVRSISYYEALAYAEWAGARLPTEEEWEKAVRGIDGRAFPAGQPSTRRETDFCRLRPLVDHPQTPYGCDNLTDTCLQWTASREDTHSRLYVAKGNTPGGARMEQKPARRRPLDPAAKYFSVGIALCQDLPPPPAVKARDEKPAVSKETP